MRDLAVVDVEDGHLGDVGEPASSWWVAAPGALVGGRAGEPADDLVRFGDEVDDRHVRVGERGPERGNPPAGAGDEVGGVHVVGSGFVSGMAAPVVPVFSRGVRT
jgi:hypothetical protein